MLNKFRIMKLMIAVVIIQIIVYCKAYTQNDKEFIIHQKPANCFCPNHCKHCHNGNSSLPDTKVRFWFFHPIYKVCIPYRVNSLNENCCTTGLNNTLRTRKECEDLCAEPCIITHLNYKTEPGICTIPCHITGPDDVQQSCPEPPILPKEWGTVRSRCCPRGYKFPYFYTDAPNEHEPSYQSNVFMTIMLDTGNKSNVTVDKNAP